MIKIFTLGDFDIKLDDNSIIEAKGYPNKTMKLFKYFLTFKDKRLLPDRIIEDLWIDSDIHDPKNVLRTQISRVRQMINVEEQNKDKFYTIEYANGYYVFKLKKDVIVDVEAFEKNINEANLIIESQPDKSLSLLKDSLELYKGEYLREMEYEEWLVPVRNRYHRLYLQGLFNYIEILKQKGRNQEIVKICEEAIEHEPYGEALHIYFIEALIAIGEKRYAISHYEYVTSRLYSHLGVKPSPRMKVLYKQLQLDEENIENTINLSRIDEELKGELGILGALVCEPYYFKFLYNLETRKKSRDTQKNRFLGIATIESRGYFHIEEKDLKVYMSTLIDIVYNNLRRGDVLSRWNNSQLVSLLYDIEEKNLDIIVKRLQKKFYEQIPNKNIILNIRFKPL